MRRAARVDLAIRLLVLALPALAPAAAAAQIASFVHTVTVENRDCASNQCTRLDHPMINDNPDALIFVTANWNPVGSLGVYYDSAVGVALGLDSGEYYWMIRGSGEMPLGASFNVLVLRGETFCAFRHTATSANTADEGTVLDHPTVNNYPGAIIWFTQRFLVGQPFLPQGVRWLSFGPFGGWAIVNEDATVDMALGTTFHVLSLACDAGIPGAFFHTATAENTVAQSTYFEDPFIPGQYIDDQRELMIVTQHTNYGGGLITNPHAIGVWYNGFAQRWATFNQDLAAMPLGADFNVGLVTTIFASGFETGDFSDWAAVVP